MFKKLNQQIFKYNNPMVSDILSEASILQEIAIELLGEDENFVEGKEYKISIDGVPSVCVILHSESEFDTRYFSNPLYKEFSEDLFRFINVKRYKCYLIIIDQDIIQSYDVLNKLGIKFLSKSGKIHLGSGMTQSAFLVEKNGKHAVMKISKEYNDLNAAKKLFELKNSLGELGKHIMEIYDDFSINDGGQIYYVYVTEYLKPIPANIAHSVFRGAFSKQDKNARINILKNEDILKQMILNLFNKYGLKLQSNIIENFSDTLSYLLSSYFNVKSSISFDKMCEFVDDAMSVSLYQNKSSLTEYQAKLFKDKLFAAINLINDDRGNLFPYFWDNGYPLKQQIVESYPEVASIVKLFKILKEKYNITAMDTHENNIMQRDDGTLVISDPGNFSL